MSRAAGIAIIAALPREVAGLVKGVTADLALRERGIHRYRLGEAVVVAAGMGAERAALAVGAALEQGGIGLLVSAGLAGACLPMAPGLVLEASVVVDVRTGEKFGCDAPGAGEASGGRRAAGVPGVAGEPRNSGADQASVVLATGAAIASMREKARLADTYGAAMADMEAASVARLARAHGLGFRAIKGISDAHDFELAALSRFSGRHGSFRTRAFALHTAARPWTWRHAVRLGRGSSAALTALQRRLGALLQVEE